MAHRQLLPADPHGFLTPDEVLRRLRTEFQHVEADREAARDHIGDMLVQFLRMDAPKDVIDRHRAAQDVSIQIIFGDDPRDEDAMVHTVAMPREPLFIGFCSARHEERSMPLIERCARVLGYVVRGG